MLNAIRRYRTNRRIKLLVKAQKAFKNGDIQATWHYLGKLTGSTSHQVHRAFQTAGIFRRKTACELLREALEPVP